MEFYERVSGARLHAAFIRPLSYDYPLTTTLLNDILDFLHQFSSRIDELEELLTINGILNDRLCDVGIISKNFALSYGFSGPLLRSAALPWDLRKTRPYEAYESVPFNIPVGIYGDSYDRYLLRIWEMRESSRLCSRLCELLFDWVDTRDIIMEKLSKKYQFNLSRNDIKTSMESVIIHFKNFSKGFPVPQGFCTVSTETPKGEFAISLAADGDVLIDRCKIRAPGFFHLAALVPMSRGLLLADVVAVIGTLDVVFGEIDR